MQLDAPQISIGLRCVGNFNRYAPIG